MMNHFVLRSRCSSSVGFQIRGLSNKAALFSKIHRLVYAKMYPTVLVYPNGASITIRHPEPRKIIRLPLDLESLSDEEKRERLEMRKPKKRVVIEEEVKDSFNANKYIKFIKKKN